VARLRKKEDRLKQIYRWLDDKYPTPYPTKLKLVRGSKPRSDSGYVMLSKRKLIVYIDVKYPLHFCIDTLLHEYGHAISWRHVSMDAYIPDHSDEWGVCFARIYRDFVDEGGDKESGNY